MASRWTHIRETIAEMSDMIAIGQAVEARSITTDQARAAIIKIGERRSHSQPARSDLAPAPETTLVSNVEETRELETVGTR